MTKRELIAKLTKLAEENVDTETDHDEADRLLCQFINDPEITAAYDAVPKWHS